MHSTANKPNEHISHCQLQLGPSQPITGGKKSGIYTCALGILTTAVKEIENTPDHTPVRFLFVSEA